MTTPAARADRDDVLRYLCVFLSVAHTGSVTRSSEQIFKAASAITRALTQMEQLLGVSLFERRPRGMLLNAYGEAVHLRARRIQAEIRQAATTLCNGQSTRKDPAVLTQLLLSGNKLRVFVSLASHGQIAASCHHLGMSKSGISMSLARLEESVGQPLFQRTAQGLVVSEAAEPLLLHAKRVFAEVRHMQADLMALQGSVEGCITVGALPLGRTRLLPLAIVHLLQKYPGIQIKTRESSYEELARDLGCGDIDFIFGALRPQEENRQLVSEALFVDQVRIFCRANHPLTRTPGHLSLATLQHNGWILPRQDSPARRALVRSFTRQGLSAPQPSVESGDLAVVRNLLTHSDLLTACSPHQLRYEMEKGDIVELNVDLGDAERSIGIIQRSGCHPPPAMQALLEEVRKICASDLLPCSPPAASYTPRRTAELAQHCVS
ncbi:LysR family transcriptional regulator [Aquitalea palustris]|nr:LysR family transcriptional regulator [Aquitalea palustris]